LLWKNYNQKHLNLSPPKFGLNFIEDTYTKNKNFMLLCGFENFDKYFVRIDILERLFVQIINTNKEDKDKNKEVKLIPEMLNLLGCSKENFKKLIKNMNYKIYEKGEEIYFKYSPNKNKSKKFTKNNQLNDNPFKVLKNINFS